MPGVPQEAVPVRRQPLSHVLAGTAAVPGQSLGPDQPRKVYRFATQQMGGYDRLKDVTGVLLAVRGDTNTDVRVTYGTDYETREDQTPIRSYTWRFLPRNLAFRYLGVLRFATVVRRRPGCRHVRHFWMKLDNETAGTDMSVISAQIFYRYQGRQR